MLNERKEKILQLVVEKYTQNAEPIGSKFLVEECGIEVSGATVRNEMRELEEQGFLTHPHTSSGRMPTEQGFAYYVDHIMKTSVLPKKQQTDIIALEKEKSTDTLKEISKYISRNVSSAVMVAFGEDSLYYTGLSNLFSQPEFRDYAFMVRMSTIFDHVEDRIADMFELFSDDTPKIIIGEHNPFGTMCGLVGGKTKDGSLVTILGPMRMDYRSSYSFIDYLQNNI